MSDFNVPMEIWVSCAEGSDDLASAELIPWFDSDDLEELAEPTIQGWCVRAPNGTKIVVDTRVVQALLGRKYAELVLRAQQSARCDWLGIKRVWVPPQKGVAA